MQKHDLRDYQIQDLSVAIRNPKSWNFSHPGTGKTPVFCALSWYYWSRKGKKTVIVQPNHLRSKNRLEVLRFSGFKPEEVVVLEKATDTYGPRKRVGTRACQKTGFINFMANPDAKVFCVGFAFLKTYWEELMKYHPEIDLVIVDEGHLGYKTFNSKASIELMRMLEKCSGFYYCTGTPIDGRLDTAFVPIHIVNSGYYGSYRGFMAQHAGALDDYDRVIYWINEEKVTEIFNRHGVLRTWSEVHGQELRNIVVVDDLEMKPRMSEAYREFETLAFVELDGMLLDGTTPGVATLRARQIINCPHIFGIDEPTSKHEYLEGIAEPGTVVFSSMPAEVESNAALLRNMGLRVGVMHGGTPHKKRVKIDLDYQNEKLDCICATPAVSATGWNWQRTKNMVFTSLDYLDSNLSQAIRRGERELRLTPLNIYFLEYADSVDQRVRKIVTKKGGFSDEVMKNVKGLK